MTLWMRMTRMTNERFDLQQLFKIALRTSAMTPLYEPIS